ncbi:MAG: KilA-N, DNA-binding domain protein [Parcubacteria group bacterium GW2011_GWC1_45_14]|nr:MAG: KilA-N, DNA-binding domain protein [Candidatus Moranbacteria bacterium GW2011_GWC2_45_10]KKT95177.1 MAG: KilA-N, DNA-binding domain protein [Parcubacteria group bacterium GW2011_GWC1_45_14]
MLDSDLAVLYDVETKNLNKAVKRNIARFPDDFMFQLNKKEFENLRFQIVTSGYGGRRYLPYVFTEQGVAMLSSVLNSRRAIEVNIQIIRTFVKLREMIISNKELRTRIEEMERRYDKRFKIIFDTLREFLKKEDPDMKSRKNKIGFESKKR